MTKTHFTPVLVTFKTNLKGEIGYANEFDIKLLFLSPSPYSTLLHYSHIIQIFNSNLVYT